MIVYQDNDIAVCEKPYGVSSQDGMLGLLKEKISTACFAVHRLDTQTTGLIVYAKSKESAASLSRQIAEGRLKKEYLCVCHGRLEEQGEMHDLLFHDKLKNKSFVVATKRKGSKEARLEFLTQGTLIYKEKELSLVKIKLHTGRTHQIRVQLSSRGFTLYGDGKYGAKDNDKIALHSYKLSFVHPTTGKELTFTSLPKGEIWQAFLSC